jgi:RNA polymerase sigma factor (sigma-70 family)
VVAAVITTRLRREMSDRIAASKSKIASQDENPKEMGETDWLAKRFQEHRTRLRAVAYRMLGSVSDADDALQEAWLRLTRSDADQIRDLEGWLITVVARVCLDHLRWRRSRREDFGPHLPEPIVSQEGELDPEQAALIGDAVGLAMLVVLDTLTPTERIAFVLHDVFGIPFNEIAPIVGRSREATRQLASRARRRVRQAPVPDADLHRQRAVVDAFFTAARAGDFEALMTLLDPDVVVRADLGAMAGGWREVRGAQAVADQAMTYARFAVYGRPAFVNGATGIVASQEGLTYSIASITVREGKIVEIDILADPDRLQDLDLTFLDEPK